MCSTYLRGACRVPGEAHEGVHLTVQHLHVLLEGQRHILDLLLMHALHLSAWSGSDMHGRPMDARACWIYIRKRFTHRCRVVMQAFSHNQLLKSLY